MTGPEKDIIGELTLAINGINAREDQRRLDKAEDDNLRRRLRDADEQRWQGFDDRMDRVQRDVISLRREISRLPQNIDEKLRQAAAMQNEMAILTADKVRLQAEQTARDLAMKVEATARELKAATALVAEVKREREGRQAVGRFLTRTGRIVLSVVVVAIIVSLMVVVYWQRHNHDAATRDIATIAAFATLCVPFVVLLLGGFPRPYRTKHD